MIKYLASLIFSLLLNSFNTFNKTCNILYIFIYISLKTDASGGMELEIPTPGTPSTELQINVISTHVENPPDCNFHTIILDCSSWGFVDTMGVKVLISVSKLYRFIR